MKTQSEKWEDFWVDVVVYIVIFFKKIMIPIICLSGLILLFCFGFLLASDAHDTFETIPQGEITLIENGETVYVPKGAYILGETHFYGVADDVVFDDVIPENKETDREQLVRTSGKVVVYWSLDQKAVAQELLDS